MPRRKEDERFVSLGSKNIWSPYGLQSLSTEKFGNVATLILSGKHNMLSFSHRRAVRIAN
ncbi:MAG: hypothetical protein IIB00_09440 [candidate division Zixibacteria bacterium]|nr:hypothetical protein [candidate division Zixibacteria bacterium]